MKLRTELKLLKSKIDIDLSSKVLLMGSCFSDNIGGKLADLRMQPLINPYGTLYNAESILQQLIISEGYTKWNDDHYAIRDGNWYHYDVHSSFSASSQEQLSKELTTKAKEVKSYFSQATHLIITLGTAWVYSLNDTFKTVANCQKMPSELFTKKLLNVGDMARDLSQIVEIAHIANPNMEVIWTLSPVRHTKDGIVENSRSKANCLAAIHQVVAEGASTYFPSYELMMDDLRDYRFYKEDLIHPSTIAVDYIWEAFVNSYFSSADSANIEKINKLNAMINHKPFDAGSEGYQAHLNKIIKLETELFG